MAQNDIFRRYTEAGLSLSRMTRARAQEIVRDLVKTGEVQREQATKRVDDLLERSRKSTEELVDFIGKEVRKQVSQLRLVTTDDLQKLLDRLATSGALGKRLADEARKRVPAKKATAKKHAAKKSPAKKSPAKKKAAAKRSPAKKSAAPGDS